LAKVCSLLQTAPSLSLLRPQFSLRDLGQPYHQSLHRSEETRD
jgi:hypothetical protein